MCHGKRGAMGHTFVIAEAGLSHCGDLDHAKDLAKAAKNAGASCIKFQTFFGKFPDLVKYELTETTWCYLFETCNVLGIEWMSTPFDKRSIDFLAACGMSRWKISSGKNKDTRFLNYIASTNPKWVYLSTGMTSEQEVQQAIDALGERKGIVLMQCTTAYPAPYDEVNLNVLKSWSERYKVGFSDHTEGIWAAVHSVNYGASVIEKHFCLSRQGKGPDDHMSLEPHEFAEMVKGIRIGEVIGGNRIKQRTASEDKVEGEIRGRMR